MGRIRDLINSFLKPSESEKTLREIALAQGMKLSDIEALYRAQEAVRWTGYSETSKKVKKIPSQDGQSVERIQPVISKQIEENDRGNER